MSETEDDEVFEFDAPMIRDFTKKEYQSQKKQIEVLLKTHGNPGVPQDPSKIVKEKKKKVERAAPRKTFFSELFRETEKEKEENKNTKTGQELVNAEEDVFNQSVDDRWFEKKEKETESFQDMSVKSIAGIEKTPMFTQDLFASEEERDILPQLKVIATPPIKKQTKRGIGSAEFNPKEIEELSKSLAPLYYNEDSE
ncbi:hypothetical protein NEMIN01_1147 [Nematocida minor]|uniref:uncharacterized protein n=1 Tax=Nematocida minor TaxID=1912983 RepID=UPI00221F906F|nr:uncharacterized protein NEMIN01_1147 [Nematocida minor]KAI5190682.1 hypothetical protein NEMIN01_1147 [Nematocida minor]